MAVWMYVCMNYCQTNFLCNLHCNVSDSITWFLWKRKNQKRNLTIDILHRCSVGITNTVDGDGGRNVVGVGIALKMKGLVGETYGHLWRRCCHGNDIVVQWQQSILPHIMCVFWKIEKTYNIWNESYVCCICVPTISSDEVPGFSGIPLPQEPSGLEPRIVAFAPQALTDWAPSPYRIIIYIYIGLI